MSIQTNLARLRQQIPPDVCLVAVSKYAAIQQIEEAYACDVRDFGENKIQDVQTKFKVLPPEIVANCRWHFLGHLQKNKIKQALQLGFHCIQSVDSLALAQRLSQGAVEEAHQQRVLLQVNITQAPQQFGFSEEDLQTSYAALLALPGLQIDGLMAIGPPPHETGGNSKSAFQAVAQLRDALQNDFGHPLPQLSMGMSEDFEHAMQCGATILRIGNRVFGIT